MTGTLGSTQGSADLDPSQTVQPFLFRVLDCARPQIAPARYRLSELDQVVIGRGDDNAKRVVQSGARVLELTLADPRVSSVHAQMKKMLGRWVIEDAGSRNGVLRNGTREQRAVLADGDVLELGQTFFVFRIALAAQLDEPPDVQAKPGSVPGFSTLLPALAESFRKLEGVAKSEVSVVIQGESGTGKELVARAVHQLSGRSGSFVAVNCGALPETLIETELFGYRKGAFSGANEDRPGLVRSADRGTLFLDEIGDLPRASQAAFLRVLQEREVTPIGGTKGVSVDLRLCTATHRELDRMVDSDEFRGDLFARISGFTMQLPALRERREDLGILIASLIPPGATLTKEAARVLFRHEWPLNIRELEKCLEVAAVVANGAPIGAEHLPETVKVPVPRKDQSTPQEHQPQRPVLAAPPELSPEDVARRKQMIELLTQHEGNISALARAMGKERVQIRRWLQRYQLDPDSFKR